MSIEIETEARIFGGLPVLVFATVYEAEPDVGIFDEQIEIDDICWLSGKSLPVSMHKRITRKDDAACIDAVRSALG